MVEEAGDLEVEAQSSEDVVIPVLAIDTRHDYEHESKHDVDSRNYEHKAADREYCRLVMNIEAEENDSDSDHEDDESAYECPNHRVYHSLSAPCGTWD